MSSTTTTTATATAPATAISTPTYSTTRQAQALSRRNGPGHGGVATTSTPNLSQLYTAQSSSRLVPPSLARKASLAALTHNSLASIPDDSESYGYDTVLAADKMPAPLTPARPGPKDSLAAGDVVDVPGNMHGTVRFIGQVQNRKGTFAGVELHPEFASRGKNSGDVDGVFYFTTSHPGAGIFLPLSKAVKRDPSTAPAASSFPMTPRAPASGGLRPGNPNPTTFTPPTPSLPKFSQSVGPGIGRAASPAGKKPRGSFSRPESPARRMQLTTPRPAIAAPGPKAPARYGSPTPTKLFTQSVRGPAGDPSKRPLARDRVPGAGLRSASAMGTIRNNTNDEEATPAAPTRKGTNGSIDSASSLSLRPRPASRVNNAKEEELDRLRTQLEDRERQLKDQATTLAEMESSLTELSGLIENSNGPPPSARRGSVEDKDAPQLRALLREKNEKIAMLTAEFDAHRADFRSTIDTLEMASAETERVYEKRMEELMQEIQELQDRTADVDNVASQLKQLEELVQELEEGLEDARRGEAEARGEVEFLRGEVERTRSELRREREKAQATANGTNGAADESSLSISGELEQKEDEIRGLKAIIHSLSRDSVPGGDAPERMSAHGSSRPAEDRLAREKLEREVADLRALMSSKSSREEELEREIEVLRRGVAGADGLADGVHNAVTTKEGGTGAERNSFRDSRGTVVLVPRSPDGHQHKHFGGAVRPHRGATIDTAADSDAYSTATENSTPWCEICETAGHDILTCTNMFGPQAQQERHQGEGALSEPAKTGRDVVRQGLKSLGSNSNGGGHHDHGHGHGGEVEGDGDADIKPAPLSPLKGKALPALPAQPRPEVRAPPDPMGSGPVAGKESGVVDAGKWCALCERDGHDSVDCPFEDDF